MQTATQSSIDNITPEAPVCPAGEKSSQIFDLSAVVTHFCSWYTGLLADNKLQTTPRIGSNIPQYVLGNEILFTKMLMETAKNSLLHAGGGAVSVEINARQHTRRRYRLYINLTLTGTTISPARQEELFDRASTRSQEDGFRLRSKNLYYAKMIAESLGGEIRLDGSSANGVRYLVEVSLFCPPS